MSEEQVKQLRALAEWLQNEAEELIKQVTARKGHAQIDEYLLEDVRMAHKLAEQMAGRKLPRQSVEEVRRSAAIQKKIIAKLEVESKQLCAWSDTVREVAAGSES